MKNFIVNGLIFFLLFSGSATKAIAGGTIQSVGNVTFGKDGKVVHIPEPGLMYESNDTVPLAVETLFYQGRVAFVPLSYSKSIGLYEGIVIWNRQYYKLSRNNFNEASKWELVQMDRYNVSPKENLMAVIHLRGSKYISQASYKYQFLSGIHAKPNEAMRLDLNSILTQADGRKSLELSDTKLPSLMASLANKQIEGSHYLLIDSWARPLFTAGILVAGSSVAGCALEMAAIALSH